VSLSGGISFWVTHGAFGIFFSVADYSLANKDIKHVFKLYTSLCPAEYYDWKHDMENFLCGCGLNSCMQLFFAKKTFSDDVLMWWRELHKRHIMRRRTLQDMERYEGCATMTIFLFT